VQKDDRAKRIRPAKTNDEDQILEDLVTQLRSSLGDSVRILENGSGRVTLQIGSAEGAILGLRIKDPSRPSFAVSYPALAIKKDGPRHVRDVGADGVVFEGVKWIVDQLAQHGVVLPEY
jgi:hypothetical protein